MAIHRLRLSQLRLTQIDYKESIFVFIKDLYLKYLRDNQITLFEDLVIQEFLENADMDILKNSIHFQESFRKRLIYHKLF